MVGEFHFLSFFSFFCIIQNVHKMSPYCSECLGETDKCDDGFQAAIMSGWGDKRETSKLVREVPCWRTGFQTHIGGKISGSGCRSCS